MSKEIRQEDLTELESELLIHFRKIRDEHLQPVAIHQAETLSDFDPNKTLWDAVDLIIPKKTELDFKRLLKR